jgi:hypothetical protein
LVASLELELPEPLLGVELPAPVLGVEPLEPLPDDPKLEFDEPPLKPPYVVS